MTQATSPSPKRRDARRGEQAVVFSIGAYRFAISAAAVQEIRGTEGLGGTVLDLDRPSLRKVQHIMEREARSYYVVSGCEHFHLALSRPTTVLILRGVPVAVLADRIEEMAEIRALLPLPRSFQGEERTWYRGLTVLGGKVLPVVNPGGFLTAGELELLEEQNPGLVPIGATNSQERERA